MTRRPSHQTVAVLQALADDPAVWRYGYELGRQVNLKAGSLYPILMRLSDRGLLESSWETNPPQGRPPRHLYRLTSAGVELAAEVSAALGLAESVTRDAAATRARPKPRSAW